MTLLWGLLLDHWWYSPCPPLLFIRHALTDRVRALLLRHSEGGRLLYVVIDEALHHSLSPSSPS